MIGPLPRVPAPFQLNATVVTVHDGDGLGVIVDWGKRRYEGSQDHPQPIRLLGCNARELGEPGGVEARDHLAALLPPGTRVVLLTVADDKFAPRWDCSVVYAQNGFSFDLTTQLVVTGWAAPWNGQGSRPLPPWPPTMAIGREWSRRLASVTQAVTEWRAP